ncbi:MAG: glycogen synthase [Chitinispirillaceae bacterium]|jgi:starch synthase|nr:glycogen synthase [Chitinispirillaceae bacterium]
MNKIANIDKSDKRKILILASEMFPYAKMGGLADVVSSLSCALRSRGHDLRVVMPRYGQIDPAAIGAKVKLPTMGVWMGTVEEWCLVYEAIAASGVPVYFIEHNLYFDRPHLYHDAAMNDYKDNPRRYAFLCRAGLELCKNIGFIPDIVHCNDWQTALGAAYLKIWHWNDSQLRKTASLLTLHNAAHQGVYTKSNYEYMGLGWHNFTGDVFQAYDEVAMLKGSLSFADMIVPVSPTFAKEILQPAGGFGLAPYFSRRSADITGILNGIDYSVWNPETDAKTPAKFSVKDLTGKKKCKAALRQAFWLAADSKVPVIGAIGRFGEQKGFGLIRRIIERLLDTMAVQFVILGEGDRNQEGFFKWLPSKYPGRAGSFVGFDDTRAHLINSGCDFLLMPSQFEPCGLNQMYAQRYGTLPIVHAVGGLDDTVDQYNETTGEGTGYKFHDFTDDALYYTIGWAISTWYDRPAHHAKMIAAAMKKDFSWESSAVAYEKAYDRAIQNKQAYDAAQKKYYW